MTNALLVIVILVLALVVAHLRNLRKKDEAVVVSSSQVRRVGEEDEDDWPDALTLWSFYAAARMAAFGHGADFTMGDTDDDAHAAIYAAQAVGQAEGARLRSSPEGQVPLMTVGELDDELWRLVGDPDETEAEPDPIQATAAPPSTPVEVGVLAEVKADADVKTVDGPPDASAISSGALTVSREGARAQTPADATTSLRVSTDGSEGTDVSGPLHAVGSAVVRVQTDGSEPATVKA